MENNNIDLQYFIDDWNIDIVPMKKTSKTPKECNEVVLGKNEVMYQLVLKYIDKMEKQQNEFIIGAYTERFVPANVKKIRKLRSSVKSAKTPEEKMEILNNIKKRLATIAVNPKDEYEDRKKSLKDGFLFTKEGYDFAYDSKQNFAFTSQKTIAMDEKAKELVVINPGEKIYRSPLEWMKEKENGQEIDKKSQEEKENNEDSKENLEEHKLSKREQFIKSIQMNPAMVKKARKIINERNLMNNEKAYSKSQSDSRDER